MHSLRDAVSSPLKRLADRVADFCPGRNRRFLRRETDKGVLAIPVRDPPDLAMMSRQSGWTGVFLGVTIEYLSSSLSLSCAHVRARKMKTKRVLERC